MELSDPKERGSASASARHANDKNAFRDTMKKERYHSRRYKRDSKRRESDGPPSKTFPSTSNTVALDLDSNESESWETTYDARYAGSEKNKHSPQVGPVIKVKVHRAQSPKANSLSLGHSIGSLPLVEQKSAFDVYEDGYVPHERINIDEILAGIDNTEQTQRMNVMSSHYMSFDYVRRIPDLRALWGSWYKDKGSHPAARGLPPSSVDLALLFENRLTRSSALGAVVHPAGNSWNSYGELERELQAITSDRGFSYELRLLKDLYVTSLTLEDLKKETELMFRFIVAAPVLSYVLCHENQSFRYFVIGSVYYGLIELATEKNRRSSLYIENEVMVLLLYACDQAFKWLYKRYSPSVDSLVYEIAKRGSIDVFQAFVECLDDTLTLNLLTFLQRAVKNKNHSLCIHILDLYDLTIRDLPNPEKQDVTCLSLSKAYQNSGKTAPKDIDTLISVSVYPVSRVLETVLHTAAIHDAYDIIISLKGKIDQDGKTIILDIASKNGSSRVFEVLFTDVVSFLPDRQILQYFRSALNNGNRTILEIMLSQNTSRMFRLLFELLGMKADIDLYPVPTLERCWNLLPLSSIADTLYLYNLPSDTFQDLRTHWPNMVNIVTREDKTLESIREALLYFPEDPPKTLICSKTARRVILLALTGVSLFIISIIAFLAFTKLYG